MTDHEEYCRISGVENGVRLESRVLEELIQKAVAKGERRILVDARGQHGIGGRLWAAGEDRVSVTITGQSGQRTGSLGCANTTVEILGPASDDVGWLNAGATIVVHGNATNGVGNAMAQGRIMIAGNIGARGMTMTKANPRFMPPQLWVLGGVGDYFAEFMAGGTAVVCGLSPQNPENVLGFRPCVGMVRGRIFVRGPHRGFSEADAKLAPIEDSDWEWLLEGLGDFLFRVKKTGLMPLLTRREEWSLIEARSPHEKAAKPRRAMSEFRRNVWDHELGTGGLVGDLLDGERGVIEVVTTGELRRFVPVWENRKHASPCEAACPSGIPVSERWRLVREGKTEEAVNVSLLYSPFPATVCGYLCPNLCMGGCTRNSLGMTPIDVGVLGRASLAAKTPDLPPLSGKKIAVVGGGVAGISVAWQLRLKGHEATVYDREKELGGKLSTAIPPERIPPEVLSAELKRVREVIPHVTLKKDLDRDGVSHLAARYDFVVMAAGASKPRMLPVPGIERAESALDFLRAFKSGKAKAGKKVVVIGAGNVGCDVASSAFALGAESVTLVDVQKPAAFGKERDAAEKAGAKFLWPLFTKEIREKDVLFTDGTALDADTVVVSIGDAPETGFLPETVQTQKGFITVDENFRTTDPKIFAVGDIVRPGLLTDAIGAGKKAAEAMHELLSGRLPKRTFKAVIPLNRVNLAYFDPKKRTFSDTGDCAGNCSSCGLCRDCGICAEICPKGAISRTSLPDKGFEMTVNAALCIGCGFCMGACPCGVWNLTENSPL
ncbi:MAG: FAD-dependent oxidoreductase [Deltaproteobacteria bacterium]|nr:FAD-dependent oxidoreductase [Deltaproteobacteria bacterium]